MADLTLHLNARLRPMDRGEHFEDPLDEALAEGDLGETTGGGTLLSESGEIESCDIELEVSSVSDEMIQSLTKLVEAIGAPKGSKIVIEETGAEHPVGKFEGLAVYLNGTDLPVEIYQNSDINFVFDEFNRLLGDEGKVYSYWEGGSETALYLYGPSFEKMQASIAEFVATYPLCQRCRTVQIV